MPLPILHVFASDWQNAQLYVIAGVGRNFEVFDLMPFISDVDNSNSGVRIMPTLSKLLTKARVKSLLSGSKLALGLHLTSPDYDLI